MVVVGGGVGWGGEEIRETGQKKKKEITSSHPP